MKLKSIVLALFLFIIAIVSLYASWYLSTQTALAFRRGWYVSPGDTFGYGVYAYDNSEELISIVDHIYSAYRLDILERDIFENKIFRIRILSIRETINFTELWTEMFNFSYSLGIARILTKREVPIKWPLLPFAVPVGYWDDLIDALKRLALIENIRISYAYRELASEYEFNITLSLGSQIIYLWYVWSKRTGVLDVANIIVMQNDNYDALHIVLESIFFQRERNLKNILYTILSLLLILVGITSLTLSLKRILPLEKVRNFLESRKKKIIEQKRTMKIFFDVSKFEFYVVGEYLQ